MDKTSKEDELKTMNNIFFYTIMSCVVISIMLFGGSLFIYHFVMGADADASMTPMWLVLFLTIAGFLGLFIYRKKNSP